MERVRVEAVKMEGVVHTIENDGLYAMSATGLVTLDYRRDDIKYHGPQGLRQFSSSSGYLFEQGEQGSLITVLNEEKKYPYKKGRMFRLNKGDTLRFAVNDRVGSGNGGYNDNRGYFDVSLFYSKPYMAPHSTEFEKILEEIGRYDLRLEAESPIGFDLLTLWDADKCPMIFLPWLAFSIGVPFWRDKWSEEQKRNIVKKYQYIRSIRGTIESLEQAYDAVGIAEYEIVDYGDIQPYQFEIVVKPGYAEDTLIRDMLVELTIALKPYHTYFRITIPFLTENEVKVAVIQTQTKIVRLSWEVS